MAICSFCGKEIEKGTGKMYVETKGTILNFCSSKCQKHVLKLGRKQRKTKWTKEAIDAKKVRLGGE